MLYSEKKILSFNCIWMSVAFKTTTFRFSFHKIQKYPELHLGVFFLSSLLFIFKDMVNDCTVIMLLSLTHLSLALSPEKTWYW